MVVEGVNVVDHLCAQLNNRDPFFPIQYLRLHSSPERLDHGIVITVTDSSKAESQAVFVDVAGEPSHTSITSKCCDDRGC